MQAYDMISFANPTEDDVLRAMTKAIRIVSRGEHDPHLAHERIKDFYDWSQVAQRTEVVYERVMSSKPYELWERIERTLSLGRVAGPIFTIILIVDCLFLMFLEWYMPRENLDYVTKHWDQERFLELTQNSRPQQSSGRSQPPSANPPDEVSMSSRE